MFTLNCNGRIVALTAPVVMGILNVTPDSFYAESRACDIDAILKKAAKMIEDGAFMLDMGGQSTRPGSEKVAADDELKRVIPAIDAVCRRFPDILISVDTFYSRVAKEAVEAGACMINDVSAGSLDADLLPLVAALQVPYVLMHMQGDPQTMQMNPSYSNVTTEVFDYINQKIEVLHQLGVRDIIIDPGFGFGKTAAHNFKLLNELSYLKQLNRPLLVGLSRKATIYKTLQITAEESLNGTTVLNTIAVLHGASILRVHDVPEARQLITLLDHLKK